MKRNVAILGCGPAGLMAAQAAEACGYEPIIFSKLEKSKLGGAQFLHMSIADINDARPDAFITYRTIGDAESYQRKVYGDSSVPFVSFSGIWDGKEQPAWNLVKTYTRLWEKFIDHIHPTSIDTSFVEGLVNNKQTFRHIFSTVPIISLCAARAGLLNEVHHFTSQEILIHTDPYIEDIEDNTIIYNGDPDRSWYRASRIFGVNGCEWSTNGTRPLVAPLITDHKPISTTCTCWPDVVRLGRRGTWRKGILTHDAYLETMKVLSS